MTPSSAQVQKQIAKNWETLYKKIYGSAPQ